MLAKYLFVIQPSAAVEDRIARLKANLTHQIGYYPSCYSKPHITIVSLWMDDSRESVLVRSLRHATAQESAISMTAYGISSFESSKTVYVKIKELKAFSKMSSNISKRSFISHLPYKYRFSSYVPHLTIGKNLNNNFDFACSWFKQYSYEETFTATYALLLKKYCGERFSPVQEFPFCSTPSGQLPLF